MDKSNTNKNPIKITFLEISPPLNELIKNKEELNIIFQGNDNFYDLKKYLSTKTPIQLSRYKKSLIITLIKSNNILAAGLFTIRPGETNVILNYENKKKIVSTKKVNINNLIECIKIKLLCEYDNKDKEKDKSNISYVNENKNNDSASKYVPKVNLMKNNQLHSYKNKTNNNNLAKKVYEKKNKYLGNFYSNNSYKKNTINNSHEFSMGGDFSSYLTEEMSNLKKNINNLNTSEIKKLNPYSSSRFYNNLTHKTETEKQSKAKNQLINKAKSKNYFSTMKKQAFGNKIKMNNSSLNLINQKNNIDNNENYNSNNNPISNRIIKPTISFYKNNKRNAANNNKIVSNIDKNLINTIDNLISGQIIEHVDKSKKGNNNSEKKNFVCINKNINININDIGLNNNENKKKKFNSNMTMNSISTAGTKKNELEFSLNSLFDYNCEDKNNSNKNNYISFTNRVNNEKLPLKLNENIINRNVNTHKFNKSLCQNSFVDKIFNENELNENEKNNKSNLCKSCDKLLKDNQNKNNNTNNLNKSALKTENTNQNNEIYNNHNINDNINDNNEKKENDDVKEKEDNEVVVEEEENLEFENYNRLKEDFNLMYNDEYIKNINEDLLKLEIELYFEKMSELFSEYHMLMDNKILENQIIKRDYKNNVNKYLLYTKLNDKLKIIKTQQNAKKNNLKENGINLEKQNYENININMNELNILRLIFPDENKSKELKKIVTNILKKQGNKEIFKEKVDILNK